MFTNPLFFMGFRPNVVTVTFILILNPRWQPWPPIGWSSLGRFVLSFSLGFTNNTYRYVEVCIHIKNQVSNTSPLGLLFIIVLDVFHSIQVESIVIFCVLQNCMYYS